MRPKFQGRNFFAAGFLGVHFFFGPRSAQKSSSKVPLRNFFEELLSKFKLKQYKSSSKKFLRGTFEELLGLDWWNFFLVQTILREFF